MEAAATIIDLGRASAHERKAHSLANQTDAKRSAELIRARERMARSHANQTVAMREADRIRERTAKARRKNEATPEERSAMRAVAHECTKRRAHPGESARGRRAINIAAHPGESARGAPLPVLMTESADGLTTMADDVRGAPLPVSMAESADGSTTTSTTGDNDDDVVDSVAEDPRREMSGEGGDGGNAAVRWLSLFGGGEAERARSPHGGARGRKGRAQAPRRE